MSGFFGNTFNELNVLVTGHTGFKGSWLSIWLKELGANVIGYSLEPPTEPSNFVLSELENKLIDVKGDIRSLDKLKKVINEYKPSLIFHLAAQPIVLNSYKNPLETFETNVQGTVNMIEAARLSDSVKAIVCVTTDKCYEDKKWEWSYRENDRLGGFDPYSASKAMVELAISSYRNSFFSGNEESNLKLASARAGNVIGGGDFASFRILPDCMRALMGKRSIEIRNPSSVRPWQHVLESLSGYLSLAQRLIEDRDFAEAWNFGPVNYEKATVKEVVEEVINFWGSGSYNIPEGIPGKKETHNLRLNSEKAAIKLGWSPVYSWREAVKETVSWFKKYENSIAQGVGMYDECVKNISDYSEKARSKNLFWTK